MMDGSKEITKDDVQHVLKRRERLAAAEEIIREALNALRVETSGKTLMVDDPRCLRDKQMSEWLKESNHDGC